MDIENKDLELEKKKQEEQKTGKREKKRNRFREPSRRFPKPVCLGLHALTSEVGRPIARNYSRASAKPRLLDARERQIGTTALGC